MIKHTEFQQASAEWAIARSGLHLAATASEFKNLVTPKFAIRTGEMPHSYLCAKISEWWQGGPLPGFGSWATEQGTILQDEALPWLELELNTSIERVGLCTTDDGLIGASPDGLIGETGLEIKCCEAPHHAKILLGGVVPDDYLAQIHGSLYVTGFSEWKFLAYRRGFPKLLLTVKRDEIIQEKLREALRAFLRQFEDAKARLIEINGGPPVRKPRIPLPPQASEFGGDFGDQFPMGADVIP